MFDCDCRIGCRKVWSCSTQSVTTSGSRTLPSFCFSTRKISLKRKSENLRLPSASKNTRVYRVSLVSLRLIRRLLCRLVGCWQCIRDTHTHWFGSHFPGERQNSSCPQTVPCALTLTAVTVDLSQWGFEAEGRMPQPTASKHWRHNALQTMRQNCCN